MNESLEREYNDRLRRVDDAVSLKEPDRVPLIPVIEHFPFFYAGYTIKDVIYDYSKAEAAMDNYYRTFKPDLGWDTMFAYPGKYLEMIDIKWFRWPGRGIDDPNASYQFVEGEYMKADDYDALTFDPTCFMMTKWLPRCFGAAEGLKHLSFRNAMWFGFFGSLYPFALPEVRESLKRLVEASDELAKWVERLGSYGRKMKEQFGIPVAYGAHSFAPFDMLGDTLRGTVPVLEDMYDRPDKLLAVLDKFLPIALESAIGTAKAAGRRYVWIWLHKGVDEFMSNEMYKKFYWPSLQKLITGLVDADLTPVVYAEGNYNTRLEILTDVPKGKVVYDFETSDIFRAKKIFRDVACIAGNVPNYLLGHGKPLEVQEYCRKLIDVCGEGGGFMMDTAALVDDAKPENLMAMFETTMNYGKY